MSLVVLLDKGLERGDKVGINTVFGDEAVSATRRSYSTCITARKASMSTSLKWQPCSFSSISMVDWKLSSVNLVSSAAPAVNSSWMMSRYSSGREFHTSMLM